MRLLFAASEVGFGGGERLFLDLVNSAINLGLEVSVQVSEHSELWKKIDTEKAHLNNHNKIADAKFDLLIANDSKALRVFHSHAKASHFICHGPWESTFKKSVFCLVFGVKVWSVSNYVNSSFNGFFRSWLRPRVLMYGPGFEFGHELKVTKQVAREMLAIPKEVFVVANVSRFHPVKRLPMFLEIIDKVKPGIYAAIAVSRNFKSIEEDNALAEFNKVKTRFTNFRLVEDGDVRLILAAADAYISTSKSETLGISMMEALRYGLPVITTAADGPADFIRPGLNGWIMDFATTRQIADSLRELALDKEKLKEMSLLSESTSASRSPDIALKQILETKR